MKKESGRAIEDQTIYRIKRDKATSRTRRVEKKVLDKTKSKVRLNEESD